MKRLLLATVALAALTLPAHAVLVAGFTEGCFGAGCTPTATATSQGLTFNQGTFSGATSPSGFFALGGAVDNLGAYTLTGDPAFYTGTPFTLEVNFTNPDTTPDNANFTALLFGQVAANDVGGVQVSFLNQSAQFLYDDAFSSGNLLALIVNSLSINPGETNYGSGFIQTTVGTPFNNPVPIPGMAFAVPFGAAGLAWAARRRRRELAG